MNKRFQSFGGWLSLALVAVVIGACCAICKSLRLRADFTERSLYTLSQGSRALAASLPSSVALKFYFSSSSAEMPQSLKSYADQVQDYLKEYELAGNGKIRLEVYDPTPDSDAEEWAQRYGLQAQQISMFGPQIYFGLVAVCGERQEALPGFDPRSEETLEYDITRLISRVAWPEKPVLGVMSMLDVLGDDNPMAAMYGRRGPQGWMVFQDLRHDYELRKVAVDAERIDDDIKTLIVVHPRDLVEKTLFAIDQFVLRGGRLIACVDPFSIAELMSAQNDPMAAQFGGPRNGPSTLGKLFDAWGVTFDTGKMVADLSLATKLNNGQGGAEENPAFLSLTEKNFAKGNLLTSGLGTMMLPFSGAFTGKTSDTLSFTPVVVSSQKEAGEVDPMTAQFGGLSAMRGQLHPDGVERTLVAQLEGEFKTAYPDGAPKEGTNDVAAATNAVPALASGKSVVLLVGDADFLFDSFCLQEQRTIFGNVLRPLNGNAAFFGNAVERFAGREELIGIRSRGESVRPFEKVDALETEALKKWQAEEARLRATLSETREKLRALQEGKSGNEKFLLSREQQDEIERFRVQQQETSRQLKNVRKNLNADIDRLGSWLKFLNIGLIPLLVVVFGVVRGIRRRKR